MKFTTLSLFIVLINNVCHANIELRETPPHNLSYNNYVNQYGIDDTCLAIIEIFFDKRENLGNGQMSFLPISTGVAVIVPPIGIGLMAVSVPLFVNGMLVRNKYSNRKLLKTLIAYQNDKILTNKMRKKIIRSIAVKADEELLNAEVYSGLP